MIRRALLLSSLLWVSFAALSASAEELALKPGDFVAVIGDSITEQKEYSVDIEDYLLMCQPVEKTRVCQFGWGGETSWGFANRMANDMLRFKPNVATTCFGMNDGGYGPLDANKAKQYRDAQTTIVQACKKAGVRTIVVGSPGCVDADTFRNPAQSAMYNKTLSQLRDICREVAQSEQVLFADVHTAMFDSMTKAKAKYGKRYHVGGGDGVHPDRNGQLMMAYAFLKALGVSGDLGTITVDLKAGQAEAAGGHKVLGYKDGAVEIESTRYPFVLSGEPDKTNATSGIVEFSSFNQDLNRYTLVVKGVDGVGAKVTWGDTSKQFTADQLAKGINLAAEFVRNPFSQPFQTVEGLIRQQQGYETSLVKDLINRTPMYKQLVPDKADVLEQFIEGGMQRDKTMSDAAAAGQVPVKHKIVIEPAI